LSGTESIRAFLDERHLRLERELDEFVSAEIAPLGAPADDAESRTQAREIVRRLGAGGWARFAVPAEGASGSAGIDLRACCLIREALAGVSPLADSLFALQCLGSTPISLAGSEEQRQRWLPGVADGTLIAAFAMTEPEAGSDVASMRTSATATADGYELNGRKTLITNAGIADFYSLFAVTGKRDDGRAEISCFIVPADAEGFTFAGAQVVSAPHPLGELELSSCRLPTSARLGEEGAGFKLGMTTLDRLRATVAAAACGMAGRALAEALDYSRRRSQFGQPLSSLQMTQQKLARMATDLEAARLLTYRAAWEADGGAARVTRQSAMAKSFATEAAQRIVDDAVQIHGGVGVLASSPVDLLYRSVRALRIYEGATEVQHLVIARDLLRSD
jgi:acyl-CoA dehydrogenase